MTYTSASNQCRDSRCSAHPHRPLSAVCGYHSVTQYVISFKLLASKQAGQATAEGGRQATLVPSPSRSFDRGSSVWLWRTTYIANWLDVDILGLVRGMWRGMIACKSIDGVCCSGRSLTCSCDSLPLGAIHDRDAIFPQTRIRAQRSPRGCTQQTRCARVRRYRGRRSVPI